MFNQGQEESCHHTPLPVLCRRGAPLTDKRGLQVLQYQPVLSLLYSLSQKIRSRMRRKLIEPESHVDLFFSFEAHYMEKYNYQLI